MAILLPLNVEEADAVLNALAFVNHEYRSVESSRNEMRDEIISRLAGLLTDEARKPTP